MTEEMRKRCQRLRISAEELSRRSEKLRERAAVASQLVLLSSPQRFIVQSGTLLHPVCKTIITVETAQS